MHRVLVRFEENAVVCGWCRWVEVVSALKHAAGTIRKCLLRLGHVFVARAMSKWLDVMQWATKAAMEAEHAQALADMEAASRLSLLDSEMLRATIEEQKREKAGRVMRHCLGKMANTQYARSWDR